MSLVSTAAREGLPSPALQVVGIALGLGGLLAAVLIIGDPALGLLTIAVSLVALTLGLQWSRPWSQRRDWPHALAVLVLLISSFDLCASRCGSLSAYGQIFGLLPTAGLGLLAHGLALATIRAERIGFLSGRWSELLIAACIGASLFFALILLSHGTWCASCVAVHGLMALQACEMFVERRDTRERIMLAATTLAMAGLCNAAFHHRLVPAVSDDPRELLAYLRSSWSATLPPAQVRQRTTADLLADQEPLRTDQTLAAGADPVPERPSAAPVTPREHDLRPAAAANRWGRADAPVTLLIITDPTCPHCRHQWRELRHLTDMVEQGRLQIRLLLVYSDDAGQAMASMAYAAGIDGEQALLDVLDSFYGHQRPLVTQAEAVQALPASYGYERVVARLGSHEETVTDLLSDAVRLRAQLGVVGEPALLLLRSGQTQVLRRFDGSTLASILRVAITSIASSP